MVILAVYPWTLSLNFPTGLCANVTAKLPSDYYLVAPQVYISRAYRTQQALFIDMPRDLSTNCGSVLIFGSSGRTTMCHSRFTV